MSFISQPFLPLWHGRPSASQDHAQDSCSAKSIFRQKSSSSTIPQSCCAQTTLCIPIFQFENETFETNYLVATFTLHIPTHFSLRKNHQKMFTLLQHSPPSSSLVQIQLSASLHIPDKQSKFEEEKIQVFGLFGHHQSYVHKVCRLSVREHSYLSDNICGQGDGNDTY